MKKHFIIEISFIVLIWFFMSFYKISDRDLWSSGETRDARIAQEMILSGDFLIPRFNGVFTPWKPPLFHWTECMASLLTEKQVNVFSSRLPSSLSFLIGALAIYFLLSGIITNQARFFASLIFLTTYKFAWMSRVAQIDPLFSVLVGISYLIFFRFYNFYENLQKKQRSLYLLSFYVFSALAVLAKGPAGIVIIAGGILLFLLLDRNISFVFKILNLWGILIFIFLGGGWYFALMITKGMDFVSEFFINQNMNRFLKAFDHKKPFNYFITQFIGGFMPWTFFFLSGCLAGLFRKKKMSKIDLFSFSCVIVVFLFFSISKSKRGVYILPLYIPAAIITANFFSYVINKEYSFSLFRVSTYLNAIFFTCLGSLFFIFQNSFLRNKLYQTIQSRLSQFDRIMFPKIEAIIQQNQIFLSLIVLLLVLTGALLLFLFYKNKFSGVLYSIVTVMIIINIFFIHSIIPIFNRHRSLRTFANKVNKTLKGNQPVYVFDTPPEDLIYYSGRKINPLLKLEDIKDISPKGYNNLFLFTRKNHAASLEALSFKYEILFDTGIQHIEGVLIKIEK